MKDTNNKTDKNKEEHCYYSGLPSPMAYAKEEVDEEVDTLDEKEKQIQNHQAKPKSLISVLWAKNPKAFFC